MTPDAYCQDRAARSGSSFYYSFLFLPPPRRAAITALYAFCREVDDVVDETSDPGVAATQLAWWRDEVARLFAGQPTHPVGKALLPHLPTYRIRQVQLEEIIDGMQMDLRQTRYPDYEGLQVYCRRVAGVVGELSAQIFGYTDPATLRYADRLGLAFQLTNIIRDVGEDARKGRIYLPIDELQAAGITPTQLLAFADFDDRSPAFQQLMQRQAQRAQALYQEAFALLPPADWAAQRAGLMMAAIYSTLLDEIVRDDYRVMHQRIALTPIRKLWLAWKTWMRARPPRLPVRALHGAPGTARH